MNAIERNDLNDLEEFKVANNSIPSATQVQIASNLSKIRNQKAMEEFFNTLESDETEYWNRSRLMFVGQGAAGKTSTGMKAQCFVIFSKFTQIKIYQFEPYLV